MYIGVTRFYGKYIIRAEHKGKLYVTDSSISEILGLTMSEYQSLLKVNNSDYNDHYRSTIFSKFSDCKKTVDWLNDNLENLLLIKTLIDN